MAEFHVFERNLYQMPQRQPLRNGILDPRLVRSFLPVRGERRSPTLLRQGTTDKKGECQTCGGKLADCGGHYGACDVPRLSTEELIIRMRRLHSTRAAHLPRRLLQAHNRHPAVRLQDVRPSHDARGGAQAAAAPHAQPKDGRAWLPTGTALLELTRPTTGERPALALQEPA